MNNFNHNSGGYGVGENIVPYGSTTATEYYWEDWFIQEAIDFYGMTDDQWDSLSVEKQNQKLLTYQKIKE